MVAFSYVCITSTWINSMFIAQFQVLFYGISLFHHLELSFDHSNFTTLLGNTFVLSAMILVLILSFIIGQLLKERASKERILFIATTYLSIFTLVAFMLLQTFKKIPSATH